MAINRFDIIIISGAVVLVVGLAVFVFYLHVTSSDELPVVLIHGLFQSHEDMKVLQSFISGDHPSLDILSINKYNGLESLNNSMWDQVEGFAEEVEKFTDDYGDITLIGYSQGALIARGIVEKKGNKRIRNLILLAGPNGGYYGSVAELTQYFSSKTLNIPSDIKKEGVFKLCYNSSGQKFSVCNYWRDPNKYDNYREQNTFLPLLNNEKEHQEKEKFKDNLMQLDKLVAVGGRDDNFIDPWQSTLLGTYSVKTNESNPQNLSFEQTDWYKKDWFGLRSLHDLDKFIPCFVPGVSHSNFDQSREVYDKCIKPHLTCQKHLH